MLLDPPFLSARPSDQRACPCVDPCVDPSEAWISFIRPVTTDSVAALLAAAQTLAAEGAQRLHLGIGSAGGNIVAGLAAFNQLRALPIVWTTYNLGSVDSVALLPFLLGEERFVDDWSSFLFHGVSWTFAGQGETAATQVGDAFACISGYERTLSAITAERTGLDAGRVRAMRAASTILGPDDAVATGIATARGAFAIPRRGRWWQV